LLSRKYKEYNFITEEEKELPRFKRILIYFKLGPNHFETPGHNLIKLIIAVIYAFKWLLSMAYCAFFHGVLYIFKTKFNILNTLSLVISWQLVIYWIYIIHYTFRAADELKYKRDDGLCLIDIASYVTTLYENYAWYAAINTLLIYVRLF